MTGEINFNGHPARGLGQPVPTTENALDPPEEQFDPPTLAIKSADQFGGHLGEVSEVLCLGSVYYFCLAPSPRRGSAQQFPPSRGVMGARSPHSKGVSLIC
jgi:hypothetical protein